MKGTEGGAGLRKMLQWKSQKVPALKVSHDGGKDMDEMSAVAQAHAQRRSDQVLRASAQRESEEVDDQQPVQPTGMSDHPCRYDCWQRGALEC
eukprot:1156128-Pelagomonas_calceolata.AAC.1